MHFNRIKMLREDRDLKQQELAKICGVKRSTYGMWEIGENIIPLKNLNILCNYYKCSIDYIVEISNDYCYENSIDNIDLKIIGQRIKYIRKEILKLTQKEITLKYNTTQSTWSAYESGKVIIPTLFAVDLAKSSNISLDWMLGKI